MTIDASRLAQLQAGGRLPGPTELVQTLMRTLDRGDASLPEIARLIQGDPVLTGRLLRLANSGAYARARPHVAVTPELLMVIGLAAVRHVALAFCLIDRARERIAPDFDTLAFWRRSLAEACAAQTLATITRAAPAAEMFTLGLVAEIGQLALAALEPQGYPALLARLRDAPPETLAAAERRAFGADQRELAVALLADWGFPKLFVEAVRWHALPPPQWPAPLGERQWRLCTSLSLAHRCADLLVAGRTRPDDGFEGVREEATALGVSDLAAFFGEIERAWRDWGDFLALPTVPRAAACAPPAAGALRVLVVEDDAVARRAFEAVLRNAGFDVRGVPDAEQALALAAGWPPQLLVADLVLPGANALELIERLRATSEGAHIHAIVVSAVDRADAIAEAHARGADDFLIKPVDARVLIARVQAGARVLDLKRALARGTANGAN